MSPEGLEQGHKLLADAMEMAPDPVAITDREGRIVYRNRAAWELFPEEGGKDWHFSDLFALHNEGRELAEEAFAIASRESFWEGEAILLAWGGEQIPISLVVLAHHDAAGEVCYYSALARDLSAHKSAQQDLQKLTRALSQAGDMVYITDSSGRVEYVNKAFERITGFTGREVVGRPTSEFLKSGYHEPEFYERLWRALRAGETFSEEFVDQVADGRTVYLAQTISPINDGNGRITHYVATAREMPERKALEKERQELTEILEYSPDIVIQLDPEGRVCHLNRSAQQLFGVEGDPRWKGKGLSTFLPNRAAWRIRHEGLAEARRHGYWEEEITYADPVRGEEVPVSQLLIAHKDAWGKVRFFSAIGRRLMPYKEALKGNLQQEFYDVVRYSGVGLIVVGRDGYILFNNPAAARLLGRGDPELAGQRLGIPLMGPTTTEIDIYQPDGQRGIAELTVTDTFWEGNPGYLLMLHDVTELREAERVEHFAFYDPVTDLPNRFLFQDRLGKALARAKRNGTWLAVAILDFDDFKQINDTFGHEAGDRFLREVARRLAPAVRETDTIARIGGDEFTLLLEDLASPDDAFHLAERVRSAFLTPFQLNDAIWTVTTSVGYTLYPDFGDDPEVLLSQADTAMYQAKGRGGNQVHLYSADLGAEVSRQAHLQQLARGALARGELGIRYQAQVALESRRIVGMEALMRWHCPGQGWISPAEFIPFLERTGGILEAGAWILREACRKGAEWGRRSSAAPRVAVNVSPSQIRYDGSLYENVVQALRESGLAPERLELEVTEDLLWDGGTRIRERLAEIKELGVRIALDDFGTGYSALSVLQELPFDTLKIDRSLVTGLVEESGKEPLLEAILALAPAMGLEVIAEGVELEEEAGRLRELGCPLGQGFGLGGLHVAAQVPDFLPDHP
ncbi:EAL domain-containing protein [Thiohalorhabdus sp. Cl-TMA]|uniref:EAL domain-containing protein n=1 Tax=Thiohalorhabdus methylotrophus TaxID=3242694 RepID=A0ABV4TU55_9GAMM